MTVALVAVGIAALVALAISWRRSALLRAGLRARERMLEVVEERLEEARADIFRFAAALDEVAQGVVLTAADGREILRNRAAKAYVGARHAEALVEPAIAEELEAVRAGIVRRRNLDLFGPPRRTLVITATALPGGGAIAVVDDVSERRRVDDMRRDFIANVSHELKTPVGALGLLAEAIADADPADAARLADRLTGEAMRVGRIIDDLLSLTHIESEELPPSQEMRLVELVEESIERVCAIAEHRDVSVDVDADHAILGDRRQLVSALANLLENACKYSDDGSPIVVRARLDGAWTEIAVEDRGVGIPPSELDRIFERFYRVDRARSRASGGTGLGLAIVRHVATNHGGEVRVTSTEGAGSTFTLRLPSGAVAVAS